jgi:hypothetical protein
MAAAELTRMKAADTPAVTRVLAQLIRRMMGLR